MLFLKKLRLNIYNLLRNHVIFKFNLFENLILNKKNIFFSNYFFFTCIMIRKYSILYIFQDSH